MSQEIEMDIDIGAVHMEPKATYKLRCLSEERYAAMEAVINAARKWSNNDPAARPSELALLEALDKLGTEG